MARFTVFLTIFITLFLNFVFGRDFYAGMFRKNDLLVAQDTLYKERVPYRAQYAKYGRSFKCPITYFRVVDRLGVDKGPRVEITRGGLRKNYIVLRLTSVYNQPISVNIYVGCENKMSTTKRPKTSTKKADKKDDKHKDKTTVGGKTEETTSAPDEDGATEGADKPADAEEPADADKPEDAEKPEGDKDSADATTVDSEAPAEDGAPADADTEPPADAEPKAE